ncbi:hypothetical protein [Capnocytophaga ochracea]|nr:hypothetical protein [Capnocytophaga ochracea]SQA92545.1 Uncharacterised protein [Capnocytophaga ochracea]
MSKGIDDAIEELKNSNVIINPTLYMGKVDVDKKGYERQIQEMFFDLIVTIEDSTDSTENKKMQSEASLKVVSLFDIK